MTTYLTQPLYPLLITKCWLFGQSWSMIMQTPTEPHRHRIRATMGNSRSSVVSLVYIQWSTYGTLLIVKSTNIIHDVETLLNYLPIWSTLFQSRFCGVRVVQSLVFCAVFCISIFVFLSLFLLSLYYMSFDFRLPIILWYIQTFLSKRYLVGKTTNLQERLRRLGQGINRRLW
jgi:hypothetical protein